MTNAKTIYTEDAPLVAYKGFGKDFRCRDFQFEIGTDYEHAGPVGVCHSGFHACTNPIDVLAYYPPATSRYAIVHLWGEVSSETGSDSKVAASRIRVVKEITLPDLARAATTDNCAHAATVGYHAHATTAGDGAHAATAGRGAHATTAGDGAHATTVGYHAHATTAGEGANATTAGYGAVATTAGYHAHATTTGNCAHATTTSNCAHATTAGNWAHATTTGDYAHATTAGEYAIAAALGREATAQAGKSGAIMLAAYGKNGDLVAVRAVMVGTEGVEPGKRYRLTPAGEIEEVTG